MTPKNERVAALQRAAMDLDKAAVEAGIRQLATHPNFPALLAWLRRNEETWAKAVSAQHLAPDHGKLSHCAGSLYAVQNLASQMAAMLAAKQEPAVTPGD